MSGPAPVAHAQEGDVSLHPPTVSTRERDEAGTANDLDCDHEIEEINVDQPAPRSPRPVLNKETPSHQHVRANN